MEKQVQSELEELRKDRELLEKYFGQDAYEVGRIENKWFVFERDRPEDCEYLVSGPHKTFRAAIAAMREEE